MLFSSQPTQNVRSPGIVYDTLVGDYVCKYQLVVGGHIIRIDTVYDDTKSFWTWLEKHVVVNPGHIKEYAWGKPTIVHSEFRGT